MRFVSALVVGALVIGCKGNKGGEGPQTTAEKEPQVFEQTIEDGNLVQQQVDLDIDGKPDIINYYRPRATDRLLVKKELDLNQDGRIDLISYFDNDGKLEKEEMDSDYDGSFDWIDHYRDGARVMSEYDTETDGKSNVFKYYETADGTTRLARKERDTDGDGKIDVWERFDAEGKVIRTGRDTDGDGKMDERSE